MYLIYSTQHTQACVFIKKTSKIGSFLPQALDIVDQDREPSEKLGSQIEEQVDQVVSAPDQVFFSGSGHGQGRQNAP